jgi:hypothetical protein
LAQLFQAVGIGVGGKQNVRVKKLEFQVCVFVRQEARLAGPSQVI